MRWIALLSFSIVLLAAVACGKTEVKNNENATPSQPRQTAVTPVATAGFYQLPTGEPIGGGRAAITEEEAQLLRSLAPGADEFDAVFPDLAPFEQELRGDLGQEYEHVDLATYGFVAGYTAFYRPSDESHTAYISFASFSDANGASSALREMIALEFGRASTFDAGAGDESQGLTLAGTTVVLLRQDRVVAFILMLSPNGEDQRDGMRQLARDVAAKMQAALAQEGG